MKKIIASAVGLALVGGVAVTTASAVESQFGGYWRTRFTFDDNMKGTAAYAVENEDGTVTTYAATNDTGSNYITDTRTRLYYTAKFSDNFKFVNKFEFDATWGGPSTGYGDVGADGKDFEIKNSYLDYTAGMLNTKVGVQGAIISRGFIFDDDFSGIVVTPDFGTVKMPILYASEIDEEARDAASVVDNTDGDVHMFSVMPKINLSDTMQLTPHATYVTGTSEIDTDLYWVGVDFDMKLDAVSAWATAIYNGGEQGDADIEGFLGAVGAEAGIVHGQAFYATGDEDPTEDDYDAFVSAPGSSYYWSEIMGLGVFDNSASNGSFADNITNIWAANVGVTLQPMDKLTAKFDVWYANLAEENVNGDDELGLEFDGMLTYKLEDNLNLDFIFAYLVADDATGDEDVMEGGVRVSLSF